MRAFASPRHRLHDPERELESSAFQAPFENPERAELIRDALVAGGFDVVEPAEWGTAPIEAVHDPGLVRFLASAWADYQRDVRSTHDVVPDVFAMPGLRAGMGDGQGEPARVSARLGWWCFETTTPITEGTYEAARSAVDVALSAATAVLDGDPVAYGLCRPPGHHAATALYGGYCFFNNAAIAADHLASTAGSRIAVLDVDYHHGNGTQQIFYERDDVAFVSLHGDPRRAYPYHTGFSAETGSGRGSGSTTNIPLATGTDDASYLDALGPALDAIDDFDPAIVVVSLGLDTFGGDPICDLALTTEGFHSCGAAVADRGHPLVVLQEGGYAGDALGANVVAWLTGTASRRDER
jgi:acetoin utilization deacetylase AcuC-like enzyme